MKKEKKIIELDLGKKDLDKLSEYLDSDNFRNYGYGHFTLEDGSLLLITCSDLVKNREEYEKYLIDVGLKHKELAEHLRNADKKIYGDKK